MVSLVALYAQSVLLLLERSLQHCNCQHITQKAIACKPWKPNAGFTFQMHCALQAVIRGIGMQ